MPRSPCFFSCCWIAFASHNRYHAELILQQKLPEVVVLGGDGQRELTLAQMGGQAVGQRRRGADGAGDHVGELGGRGGGQNECLRRPLTLTARGCTAENTDGSLRARQ